MKQTVFMKIGNNRSFQFLVIAGAFLLAQTFLFSEAAHAATEHESHEALTFGGLLVHLKYYWINFILFAGGMWYLLSKAWPGMAKSRKTALEKTILEAQTQLEVARQAFTASEKRFAALTAEKHTVETLINDETKSLSEGKVSAAQEAAKRLLLQAKERIEIERMSLSRWFKKNMIDTAKKQVESDLAASAGNELGDKYNARALNEVKSLIN